MCREEDFHDYFEGDPKLARYMLFTFRVLHQHLPAVTHVDGTARVQSITAADNWLHPALGVLKDRDCHPVIINTSFNCAGEPLVETFEQAVRSFVKMGFDFLVTEKGVYSHR
jgi:carbamoyltransferase